VSDKFDTYQEFFERCEDYVLVARFYECDQQFTVEEMYQHFKARLIAELKVQSDELLDCADLVAVEDLDY
jgi:hypothetical protein